jgi:hypothetical protein
MSIDNLTGAFTTYNALTAGGWRHKVYVTDENSLMSSSD